MLLRVMSYNIQHCLDYVNGEINFVLYADTITNLGAEIVGLNEVRDEGCDLDKYKAQAKILAEKIGYYYYFAKAIEVGNGNPYGNAILSKYPIVSAETILIPDPYTKTYDEQYETRCVLKAVIDVGEKINILITHFGLNPDEVKNAVNTVIDNLPKKRTVLMGDFNIEPHNEALEPIRQCMNDTADLFEAEHRSFPSDNPKVKIDYIFCSRDIDIISADIPNVLASDHRPYIANIMF